MQIKTSDFEAAIKSATYALEVPVATQEQKGKAYFRRAQARTGKKNEDEAVQDLEEAHKLVPNDPAIKKELAEAKKKAVERRKKEKAADYWDYATLLELAPRLVGM